MKTNRFRRGDLFQTKEIDVVVVINEIKRNIVDAEPVQVLSGVDVSTEMIQKVLPTLTIEPIPLGDGDKWFKLFNFFEIEKGKQWIIEGADGEVDETFLVARYKGKFYLVCDEIYVGCGFEYVHELQSAYLFYTNKLLQIKLENGITTTDTGIQTTD